MTYRCYQVFVYHASLCCIISSFLTIEYTRPGGRIRDTSARFTETHSQAKVPWKYRERSTNIFLNLNPNSAASDLHGSDRIMVRIWADNKSWNVIR